MRRSAVQNGRQIDLPKQVERVKRKTRPWKSIISLLLAIAAAVISHQSRHSTFTANQPANQLITYGTAVLFLVFGSVATYGLAGKSRELLEPTAGRAQSAIVRYAVLIVGAFTTLVITLLLFGVDVSQLVLGGAIPTVFLSIAAPEALGGTLGRIATDIGITYMRCSTDGRVTSSPNSQGLNAVVGPIPPRTEEP